MGGIEAVGLGWTPLGAAAPVLDGVDLRVEPGERVLLAGPSGSGKSTLLRLLAGVLTGVEAGEQTGRVGLLGEGSAAPGDLPVGLLLQDPRDARVAERVGRDVAFGLENAGLPREEMAARIAWALAAVGFPYGLDHPTTALSGGQAQRLALAGVVAPRPGVLLLDEPTSMLDEATAAVVREAVRHAVAGTDTALVIVEHRLAGWVEHVDRIAVLEGGRVVADGPVERVLRERRDDLLAAGVWVPGAPPPQPLTVPADLVAPALAREPGDALVAAEGVRFVHTPRRRLFRGAPATPVVALDDVSAQVTAGATLAVRGPSGAGKSTLVDLLVGLSAPGEGRVRASGPYAAGAGEDPHRWSSPELAARAGWVPQTAESTLVGTTVRDCLLATARALGQAEADARADGLAEVLGLAGKLDRHPHRLSGGETRRLALASALVHGPALLGLDEPTVGQDRATWAAVAGLMGAAAAAGVGVACSTHDDDLAAGADAVLTLRDGRAA